MHNFQFLGIILLLGMISFAESLQCSSIVKMEHPEILSYLGNVSFKAPGHSNGNWTAFMKTNEPFTFIGGFGVLVESQADKGVAIFHGLDNDSDVKKGDEISFRFRIHYAPNSPRPFVKSLQWESWKICEGGKFPGKGYLQNYIAIQRSNGTKRRNRRILFDDVQNDI